MNAGSLAPRDGRVSSKNETSPVCFLFHTRSSRTNQLPAHQVYCCTYCCCTAVLLYVVKVWSVGAWRVHCVVRGGWVGRSVRGSVLSSCRRGTFSFVSKIPYVLLHCRTGLLLFCYLSTYIQRMIPHQSVFVRHTGRQQAHFGSTTSIYK